MALEFAFSIETLTDYLAANITGFVGPITVEKFSGGQSNPTFKITTKSKCYVLRSQPPGKLLPSAHAVDREYFVLNALQQSKVPVAKVYHLCTDTAIIGAMFYVMEYCNGEVFWRASLPEISSNQQRSQMYDAMNKTLVDIHQVNLQQTGLLEFGKMGNYYERQLNRWQSQYQQSELQPIKAMDMLSDWLTLNLPQDDGRICLVHGDFRLDNMMFQPNSSEIMAVLDWELSTLGHPFSDLAYQCMQLRMPKGMGSIDGLQGVNRQQLGIPSEQAYVEQYCERMGIASIDHWSFYLAFSFYRLAAIVQGVAKRAVTGNASNANASTVGAYVEPLAQMALKIIEQE